MKQLIVKIIIIFKELKHKKESKISIEDLPNFDNSFVVLLDENGKEYDSNGFAEKFREFRLNHKNIVFVIANAYGFGQSAKNNSDLILSLSKMTFPHDISKLVLIEQIFRAGSILAGSSYHK